eukprot:7805902-Ditylum_brightwellii.AAC.1
MAWIHYCGSITALRRMQNHKQGCNNHPAVTTKPDFNVQLQIEHMLKLFDTIWESKHVKGYQSGRNLSWEAQLNNKTDVLATEARNVMITT